MKQEKLRYKEGLHTKDIEEEISAVSNKAREFLGEHSFALGSKWQFIAAMTDLSIVVLEISCLNGLE